MPKYKKLNSAVTKTNGAFFVFITIFTLVLNATVGVSLYYIILSKLPATTTTTTNSNEFSDDILPETTDIYSVGSEEQQWLDGHFSGTITASVMNVTTSFVIESHEVTTISVLNVSNLLVVATDIIPIPNGVYSLGNESNTFKEGYIGHLEVSESFLAPASKYQEIAFFTNNLTSSITDAPMYRPGMSGTILPDGYVIKNRGVIGPRIFLYIEDVSWTTGELTIQVVKRNSTDDYNLIDGDTIPLEKDDFVDEGTFMQCNLGFNSLPLLATERGDHFFIRVSTSADYNGPSDLLIESTVYYDF